MKQTRHPNFILGLITFFILFIGIGLKFYGYRSGDWVLIGAVALGAIHHIWSIIDVFKHQTDRSQSRKFWIIIVILTPTVGSLLYYLFGKTVRM